MMSIDDPVRELVNALDVVNARVSIDRGRIARSTLYDASYHMAIIACAFGLHAQTDHDGRRYILAAWIKMLQFVAARPSLAADLLTWARSRRAPDLQTWSRMPRGFLGDRTHDLTVDYLVASSVLDRDGDRIVSGRRIEVLHDLVARLTSLDLLVGERSVLERLREVSVNKTMFGGQ